MGALFFLGLAASTSMAPVTTDKLRQSHDRLSGLYGNVDLSPESGDLGGYEIEIHANEAKPYALFVVCEGWCNTYYRVPLKIEGDKFEFSYSTSQCDLQGTMIKGNVRRFRGQLLSGKSLFIEEWQGAGTGRWKLKPLKSRFGLDTAKPESEAKCIAAPSK